MLPAIGDTFEHAPCGLVSTLTDGTIVRVNATFSRWVGVEATALLDGRRIQDLLTMGGKVFHLTHWAPLLEMQGSVAEVKLEFRHGDGHKVPMLINAVRRRVGADQFDEFACVIVNDRHSYEQELLRTRRDAEDALAAKEAADAALKLASRHKDEFLATLAHELRNPLAPVQAAVRLLQRGEIAPHRMGWLARVLDRQVTHLTRLVDDLLDISRIAEGKFELRTARLDLSSVAARAIEGARDFQNGEKHRFIMRLPDAAVLVDGDPVRLTQVVQNLLNNAAKYTPVGGTIELELSSDAQTAFITVRDTGIGIAPENLKKVFGMFAQLEAGHDRAHGGLGVGLSLVRALTVAHGGSVTAASAGPGLGSEFTVHLPLANDEASAINEEPAGAVAPVASRRILIVDDNEDAAVSLSMLLESDGHRTAIVPGGTAALALAEEFGAEVVLLDIGLPDMSGYEVARLLREHARGSHMLLIAVTGWSQEHDKQAAASAGFDHHLAKPVDYDRLLKLVAAMSAPVAPSTSPIGNRPSD